MSSDAMTRELRQMAMLVLADRRMQGYAQDEMLELREWMREASLNDQADLRAYLERECKPILERKAMVDSAVARIKERIQTKEAA